MSIELTRVDFRLIHGQVITRWVKQCDINEIVTIDDLTAKDDFMVDVFKMAAPKGVKIRILTVEQGIEMQKAGGFDKSRVLLLFKSVEQIHKAIMRGLKLDEVQIGGLGGGPGRKAVNNAITLDRKDANDLLEIQSKGIKVYLQTTPDYSSESLDSAVAKLK